MSKKNLKEIDNLGFSMNEELRTVVATTIGDVPEAHCKVVSYKIQEIKNPVNSKGEQSKTENIKKKERPPLRLWSQVMLLTQLVSANVTVLKYVFFVALISEYELLSFLIGLLSLNLIITQSDLNIINSLSMRYGDLQCKMAKLQCH